MLTIQISTLNAPPDPTPKFAYQLCSNCAPIFVIRAVPGYVPGACNGCILDAVFDLLSSTLDGSSSTSTGSASSSTTGVLVSTIDAPSTLIPGLTSSQSRSPGFAVTSATGRSDAVGATTTPAASGGGLVTVVTGTETLTETMTSTLYLPASPGNDDQFDRIVTTCYPVTTCSEFSVTLTIPPESCTTYTTTNEVNHQVETCTEPVSWWTPYLPVATQLSALGSQDAVPGIQNSPNPGATMENPPKPESGSTVSPQLPAGNENHASPGSKASDVPLPHADAAPSGDGVEDSTPSSGSSGSALPAQPPEKPPFSTDDESLDSNGEISRPLPSLSYGAAVGTGKATSDASDERPGSGTASAVAQAIGSRARKTTATEASIVVLGMTLLLLHL